MLERDNQYDVYGGVICDCQQVCQMPEKQCKYQQLLSKVLQFIGNTIENVVSQYPLVLEAMETKSVNIFN